MVHVERELSTFDHIFEVAYAAEGCEEFLVVWGPLALMVLEFSAVK